MSRRTKTGSSRSARPSFLLDRALNPRLAQVLRDAGFKAVHLREAVGEERASQMLDPEVFSYAHEHGYVILTKDAKMARRPNEVREILDRQLHVFSLAKANQPLAAEAYTFGRHILQVVRHCKPEGPSFWRLYLGNDFRRDLPRP